MVIAKQATDVCLINDIGNWGSSLTGAPVYMMNGERGADQTFKTIGETTDSLVRDRKENDAHHCEVLPGQNAGPIDSISGSKRNKTSVTKRSARFSNLVQRFSKDEDGAITIAFVLWVPVFVAILALTVDATTLFISQANMWSVARDTSRFMAVGLYSDAEAEAYAAAQLPIWGAQSTIVASRNANFVTINLKVPIGDVAPFNISGIFTDGFLIAELSQRVEPN